MGLVNIFQLIVIIYIFGFFVFISCIFSCCQILLRGAEDRSAAFVSGGSTVIRLLGKNQ